MRELIQLQHVKIEIQDLTVLANLNVTVREGETIGIIGKNGAGKSTLLKLLNEDIVPSSGSLVKLEESLSICMAEQETERYEFTEITSAEAELLEKWNVPAVDYSCLSGGEKVKVRLARAFASNADLLLLDEPTNHLDEESAAFLLSRIKGYKGTVLFVSHDRHFLDEAASMIWPIENQTITEHKGNYTDYLAFTQHRKKTEQRLYEKQQKLIGRIEGQMKELTSWSQKAHAQSTKQGGGIGAKEYYRVKAKRMDAQVKSKRKRLEKELEKLNASPPEQDYEVFFSMKAGGKTGKRFLEVKNLTKSYGDQLLFQNSSFTIQHGERLALIGPNGSGKTTFLKILAGEETAEGDVWISPSANIGYLTQDVFDLPLDRTPEQLFHRGTFHERGHIQNAMKHLGFTASQWKEPVRHMSMGERVKLKLLSYIAEEKDVLILDEPTNHLDLASREQLEDALASYKGTLIAVSHDRRFLEKITSAKLVIKGGRLYKELKEADQAAVPGQEAEMRLRLETERQEVLGKLSFLPPGDTAYTELDRRFSELTKQIQNLSGNIDKG